VVDGGDAGLTVTATDLAPLDQRRPPSSPEWPHGERDLGL